MPWINIKQFQYLHIQLYVSDIKKLMADLRKIVDIYINVEAFKKLSEEYYQAAIKVFKKTVLLESKLLKLIENKESLSEGNLGK